MHEDNQDREVQNLLDKLKIDLSQFPEGMDTLDVQLESAAKHVPAYLKIVKSHLDQLSDVLELENHNHKTLETAGLAEPVEQLIELFKKLEEADIQQLELLAATARNWQPAAEEDTSTQLPTEEEASAS